MTVLEEVKKKGIVQNKELKNGTLQMMHNAPPRGLMIMSRQPFNECINKITFIQHDYHTCIGSMCERNSIWMDWMNQWYHLHSHFIMQTCKFPNCKVTILFGSLLISQLWYNLLEFHWQTTIWEAPNLIEENKNDKVLDVSDVYPWWKKEVQSLVVENEKKKASY